MTQGMFGASPDELRGVAQAFSPGSGTVEGPARPVIPRSTASAGYIKTGATGSLQLGVGATAAARAENANGTFETGWKFKLAGDPGAGHGLDLSIDRQAAMNDLRNNPSQFVKTSTRDSLDINDDLRHRSNGDYR
ncbi:hypothetical protein JRG19_02075 [Pseudoclavibacter alba]|uniref:Uncharacterized protein n=1 Tax=Pseudoclavibacter albus TaxID=272241 RepID=A0ABT2HWL8_9MICO|nr:hypothetical protein [Pseudoclavibacter alba]MBN6777339.1 hypothetical protein [Pseudoclavibacter alba]MCT2042704.1 hypothetical protein [Pseudoclavibacter alba]